MIKYCKQCCSHNCCCEPKSKPKELIAIPVIKKTPAATNLSITGSVPKVNVVNKTSNNNPQVQVQINHCPVNKITSITKIGDKVITTMNDCTYYESDVDALDLSTFTIAKSAVSDVTYTRENNTLKVTHHNNGTGKSTTKNYILPEEEHVTTGTVTSDMLVLYRNTGKTVDITLTPFKDSILGEVQSIVTSAIAGNGNFVLNETLTNGLNTLKQSIAGNKIKSTVLDADTKEYKITLANGEAFTTDMSPLVSPDNYVNSGTVVRGNTLHLVFKNNSTLDIDLAPLVTSQGSVLITGGRVEGTNLVLDLSNGSNILVDITELLKQLVEQVTNNIQNEIIENATNAVIDNVLKMGYKINNQSGAYTLVQDDFDGRTLVRSTGLGNQTFTITKPNSDTDMIGRAVVIRKAEGEAGTVLNLVPASGVTLTPPDITPLRRIGSTVTLTYTGSGNWDVFGELP